MKETKERKESEGRRERERGREVRMKTRKVGEG